MKVYPGDAILTFLDEEPSEAIDYSKSVYRVYCAGVTRRADFVISPADKPYCLSCL
jgi:hypothetical protein